MHAASKLLLRRVAKARERSYNGLLLALPDIGSFNTY